MAPVMERGLHRARAPVAIVRRPVQTAPMPPSIAEVARRAHRARPDVRDGRGRDPRRPDSHVEARAALAAGGARAEPAPTATARSSSTRTSRSRSTSTSGGRHARPPPRRRLRRAQGRPRRDRDAQLPRVVDRVLGGGRGRRHRRAAQRVVDGARARVRARATRARRSSFVDEERLERLADVTTPASRPRGVIVARREHPLAAAGASVRGRAGRRRPPTPRCPTSSSIPRTTPRSSTRRARPGRPKGALGTHRNICTNLMSARVRAARRRRRSGRRQPVASAGAPASRTCTCCRCRSSTPPDATRCWSPTSRSAGSS